MLQSPGKLHSIHADLQGKIFSGHFKKGDRLPITSELASIYKCSVNMASKAIAMLVHEGLVEQRRGLGTRVIRKSADQPKTSVELDAFAFICPTELHEGIRRVMHGFQDAALGARRRTLVLTTGLDPRKESEVISRLAEFDVKGAVVFPVLLNPQEWLQFSQMILACPFPVVLIQTLLPDLRRSSVHIDSLHAGYVTTKHLIERGAKRIGFLTNYASALLVREKYLGYRQAMFEAGLEEECSRFSQLQTGMQPDFADPLAEPRLIGRSYLETHPDVEAVVCAGDFFALGLLEVARELGISVPKDLKVVGMDDLSAAQSAPVSLTTYRAPFEEVGRRAFDTLKRVVADGFDPGQEIQVRGEIVVRASTA